MKNRYIITLAVLIVCSYITLSSFKTTGAHQESTGAPGEGTCANSTTGCHSSASVTNDNTNIVNTLSFSAADSSYVPGQTYSITVQAKKTGITKMGFEIVALTKTGNNNAGTWVITSAASTQIINGTSSGLAGRRYITHKSAGTTTPYVTSGLGKWTFSWTAPSTSQGDITFYYATNCTNNNGANTGDQLFLSSFTIHPNTGTSITEWLNNEDFQAMLNSVSNELILNYNLKKECELTVSLMDAQGKLVQTIDLANKSAGQNTDRINLTHGISSGMYLVNIAINDQVLTKKIMVQ